jgi:aminoglycoside phosphotransferase (APT) family kinase protein
MDMPRRPDFEPAAIDALLRHVFPGADCHFARAETGVSTPVYRVWAGDEIFYLRMAETPEASLLPEMKLHTRLIELGVKVPAIVYFDPFEPAVERSVMVTTAIKGDCIGNHPIDSTTRAILRDAGRDLAIINSIPVHGFGWVMDGIRGDVLEAEHATFHEWAVEYLDAVQDLHDAQILGVAEKEIVHETIERAVSRLPDEQGWLAHGDLDVTHIFQEHGRYTGIIDFGEIRGAHRLYDLGHFRLHDGERLEHSLLLSLLGGYQDVRPLPPDAGWHIQATALMIGVRALARSLPRPPSTYQQYLARTIRVLVDELTSGEQAA